MIEKYCTTIHQKKATKTTAATTTTCKISIYTKRKTNLIQEEKNKHTIAHTQTLCVCYTHKEKRDVEGKKSTKTTLLKESNNKKIS